MGQAVAPRIARMCCLVSFLSLTGACTIERPDTEARVASILPGDDCSSCESGQCDATGRCICDVGFVGANCQACAPDYYGFPSCRYCLAATTCSGEGSCDSQGACACFAGFSGADCSVAAAPPADDFALGVAPSSLSLVTQTSGATTLTTTVVSGVVQTIVLSVSGLPAGASAVLSPSSISEGSSSTLTVSAGLAVPGAYTLNVTGTAASGSHSAPIPLTILADPACPSLLGTCQGALLACQADGATDTQALTTCTASLASCQAQDVTTAQALATCQVTTTQLQGDLAACSAALAASGASLGTCQSDLGACRGNGADVDGDGIPDRLDRCPATPSGQAVDASGCSQTQFCARVDAGSLLGIALCLAVDWQNDEPLVPPFDCKIQVDRGHRLCVPAL